MLVKKLLFGVAAVSIVFQMLGCAAIASPGSPVHTSSLSPSELRGVDNYTLCKAATPRELYSPSTEVMREVGRRNVNCGAMYNYTPSLGRQQQQQQQAPEFPTRCTTTKGIGSDRITTCM